MLHRLGLLQRLAADTLGWGVGRDELGVLLLKVNQFVVEPVVFAVGDGGLGQDVVGVVVAADVLDETSVAEQDA